MKKADIKIHPDNNEIKSIFKEVFNYSPNFMTPNIISYGRRSRFLYELASDDQNKMFGVTVIDIEKNKTNLSRCFFDLEEARRYITNRFTT